MEEPKRITIVGAGLMGHGIGQVFARAGYKVVLHDLSEEILVQALKRIEHILRQKARGGMLSSAEIKTFMANLQTTTDLGEAVEVADLVLEAVFENLELKQTLFQQLDELCPERTILASNSSYLMPSLIGAKSSRLDRILVAHYFYPSHLIPLVEIVRSKWTSEKTVRTVFELHRAAGKMPIVVNKEAPGFIANRLQMAMLREAFNIVDRGIASAQDVDTAVKNSFGLRLAAAGPFETVEIQTGWDAFVRNCHYIMPHLSVATKPPAVIHNMVSRQAVGASTGQGFYDWPYEKQAAWKERMAEVLVGFLYAQGEIK